MNDVITSSQNKWIKHLKALQLKKYRDLHNEYIIEGIKLVDEAMMCDAEIISVIFNKAALGSEEIYKLYERCQSNKMQIFLIEDKVFLEVCETKTPQGVMAVLQKKFFLIEELLHNERINLAILDSVQDPGNVGTIIRTADACKIDGVILSNGCADIYNSKTIRSTMGSLFHLPIIAESDILNLLRELNQHGFRTIGGDVYGNEDCFELPVFRKTAIVIGNESNGLREEVKEILKHRVKIPMPGKSESLNAAVAAALLMYEITVRKPSRL